MTHDSAGLRARFEELADDVAERLKSESLPTAATQALRIFLSKQSIAPVDVLAWIADSRDLPVQEDITASFGEPPLTIVNRPEFYIQVLFWRDGTTRVHQHAFSGAFAVLSGSSIHVEYTFEKAITVSDQFTTGRLHHKSTEHLVAGDCRKIRSGSSFIHSVFHLDHPTISVVVRNHGDDGSTTQLAYRPTVALDLFELSPDCIRKLQTLDLVFEESKAEELLASMITSSDIATTYLLLEQITRKRGRVGALSDLLAHAEALHGKPALAFAESLSDLLREENIVERRKAIREPDHRRILALLLTVPNRESILAMLATMKPAIDPVETLMKGLREMLSLDAPPEWGPNALGLALDEEALTFLERVLQGATIDESAALCQDPMQGQMLALQLPLSSILHPLFRVGETCRDS